MKQNFLTENLIYNRFDLIFDNYESYKYNDGVEYEIKVHRSLLDDGIKKAYLNVWGKDYPDDIFSSVIEKEWDKGTGIISIIRGCNQYEDLLLPDNDYYIELPDTVSELMCRISSKHSYTLRREKRILETTIGKLRIRSHQESKIPVNLVDKYFEWKKASHGVDYQMTELDYIIYYHVTDAISLEADGQIIGVGFLCCAAKTAYLENFSYDPDLKKYSVGTLTYVYILEYLITRKYNLLVLGGGDYFYKKEFGAVEYKCYSGNLYNPRILNYINSFFKLNNIHHIAVYGMGKYGKTFLRLSKYLDVDIDYGIDKNKPDVAGLKTYSPEDEIPYTDAVIIALKNKDIRIEDKLIRKIGKCFWWNDLVVKGMIENE